MSNKPKIYGNCKAGCLWETVHKEDFDKSATWVKQSTTVDGEAEFFALPIVGKYKIKSPSITNAYSCIVSIGYYEGILDKSLIFTITEFDAYRNYFYFEILSFSSTTTSITIVYEVNGNRYTKTVSGRNINTENAKLIVTGANAVYLFNDDASITADFDLVQITGTSTTAVMSQKATTDELDKIWARLNYVAPTISTFTRTPATSTYKLPASFTLSKITHKETNIANIDGNLTLKRGATVLKSDIAPSETNADVTVSDTVTLTTSGVTYTLSGVDKDGKAFTKSISVYAYYTSYIGASADATVSDTMIATLADTSSATLSGQRTVEITGESKYVWFVSTASISSVKSGGFDVPINAAVNHTYNGTTYKCYRTAEKIIAGTNTFVIS